MEYAGIAIVPLIVGLSEVVKRLGVPSKFLPLLNIVLGLAAGLIFLNPGDLKAGVIQGLYIGLSAGGLFSGVKHLTMDNAKYNRTHSS